MDRGLGPVVRKWREQRKLSLRALADKARLPLATVRDIENGRASNPGVFNVAAVARALGLTLDRLLEEAGHAARLPARPESLSGKRLQIAFHEAGHVVVAYRLKVPFSYVTLDDPYDRALGRLQVTWSGDYRWGVSGRKKVVHVPGWAEHENMISVNLAGRMAEERWCAENAMQPGLGSDREDNVASRASLQWLHGDKAAIVARLRDRTRDILDHDWEVVARIAEALAERGRLSHHAVRTLIEVPPVVETPPAGSPGADGDELLRDEPQPAP